MSSDSFGHDGFDVASFEGEVVRRGDEGYEREAALSMHATAPDLIVKPKTEDSVSQIVRYAANHNLEVSVRCGGHSTLPPMANDGDKGVLIDMSALASVDVLNDGLVRIGGGAKWGDIADSLVPHELAITSGDTRSVGVGGLTLGGGFGWMVRAWGLAIDQLVSADVVLADGSKVRASESENPELFWALRGGGGNFGVVTSFVFQARPLSRVVAGSIAFKPGDFHLLLKQWRDVMRDAPEELNTTLLAMPPMGPEMPASTQILLCYAGDDEGAANKAIAPLLEIDGVVSSDIRAKRYADVLEAMEGDGPPPFKFVINNGLATELTDELIDSFVKFRQDAGMGFFMARSLGGAFSRVDPDATAFSHRQAEVLLLASCILPLDASAEDEKQVHKKWDSEVGVHLCGSYGNFCTDTGERVVSTMYSPQARKRLREIKRKYDPQNMFHRNMNITPEAG